jgi:manganese-dependent inorganic pyrophosphatase
MSISTIVIILKRALIALSLVALPGMLLAEQSVLVVGHKNPDTDAIVSAIAAARLKTALGQPAYARAQGAPNPETRFVLDLFGFQAPPIQTSYAGQDVILVDHSDYQLAPDDLREARLVGIYDHHKLGGIQTSEPIEVIIKPWGSTATVLHEQFVQHAVAIDAPLAGLLLSGILSDTRVFRSPTTTTEDRNAATLLAAIAGITDMSAHGKQMLSVYNEEMKRLDDATLLDLDLKVFQMGEFKVGISQIEAFDADFLKPRLAGLRQAMLDLQAAQGMDALVLAVTDVSLEGSTILVVGPQAPRAKTALALSDDPLGTWKPSVFSRKHQMVPPLEKAFVH